jgi:hypothetical protein
VATRFGESFSGARLRVVDYTPMGTPTITGIRTGPPTQVNPGLQEFALSPGLPISAGNKVGIDIYDNSTPAAFHSLAGASGFFEAPAIADGATDPSGALGAQEVLLNADVEPDCDADGLGDETQDPDISTCTPDTAGPETTITAGPKDKVRTRKKRSKVSFQFISSEPGSTFECSLDDAPFEPCTSPLTERVKAKRKAKPHEFRVRATDAAGNVDSTPARDDFNVKRKPRR